MRKKPSRVRGLFPTAFEIYLQLKLVVISEKARMLPVSPNSLSLTFSTQVPFATSPTNVDSGFAGLKVPV